MVHYVVINCATGLPVELDKGSKVGWTKAEAVAKANELALKEETSFEVRMHAVVHTATPKLVWDFEI